MDELDAVAIGAGVAGLVAAARLGRAGQRVVVLEARERVGRRIWTLRERGWARPVELGAEFIHGGNPVLDRLPHAAGIAPRPAPQREWLVRGGERKAADDAWDRIDGVMRRIGRRFRGSFAEWLERASDPAGVAGE